jgi:hypothetical protein
MPVTVLRKPAILARIQGLPDRVRAGVAVKGYAASYALVWEWGANRRPGPKTVFGENPDEGLTKLFTKTAPSGYVRIHKQQFYDMVKSAITSISTQDELAKGTYAGTLLDNVNRAAVEAAQLMSKDAPIDTGLLRSSIWAVTNDEVDALLQASYRPLFIGDTHGTVDTSF